MHRRSDKLSRYTPFQDSLSNGFPFFLATTLENVHIVPQSRAVRFLLMDATRLSIGATQVRLAAHR
jgi:hypothetical protein